MGISLNTLLGALSGGAHAYGQAEDRNYQRRRQAALDALVAEDRQSQRERRDYENLHNVAQLSDEGVHPASEITDTLDLSPTVSAMAGVAGGSGVGLPPAKVPNPQHYTYAGGAGGRQFYYNPDSTKEATALKAREVNRAAEVARLLGMKKPDGTPITQAEAEAVVDHNLSSADIFREHNIDPRSPEGIARDKELIDYRERARAAAKAAAAKTGKTMTPKDREAYLNKVADRYVESAAGDVGEKDPVKIVGRAVDKIVASPDGKEAMQAGLTSAHVKAAAKRFHDRFTAKSKAQAEDPFANLGAPVATPSVPAPKADAAAIKKKYGLE